MHYEEFRPAELLTPHVKCLWILNGSSLISTSPERILPDGCTEIVFQLGEVFEQHNLNGITERQPKAMIVGQMRHHLMIQPTGKVSVFGVRFWPGGAYPFLRVPQHEIAGRVIALDTILGSFARDLHSKIAGAASGAEKFRLAEKALLTRLNQSRLPDDRLLRAVRLILQARGCLSMDSLANMIGVDSRGLDRTFNTRVGIPPKTLCRIVRFQRVFEMLKQQAAPRWSRIAVECGYYDQSHFIKEFKAIAGKEPTAYLAEQNAISDHFIASQ